MAKYRKKPVVIEAYQTDKIVKIATLEGTMRAEEGDWIITGVKGERYPCKPDIFEATYEAAGDERYFGLGRAVKLMQSGYCVARAGWNGKDMFLFLVPGSTFKVNRAPLLGIYPEGTTINYHAHVDMKTVDGTIVPWLCSQSDLLAVDWFVVDQGEAQRAA